MGKEGLLHYPSVLLLVTPEKALVVPAKERNDLSSGLLVVDENRFPLRKFLILFQLKITQAVSFTKTPSGHLAVLEVHGTQRAGSALTATVSLCSRLPV